MMTLLWVVGLRRWQIFMDDRKIGITRQLRNPASIFYE